MTKERGVYFYVDESGHTGKNLFDLSQPTLYYGLLSSRVNLDILALPYLENICKKLNVDRLHASQLKDDDLASIVPEILAIHKKYALTFDFFKVIKADYALISFFDQVFDCEVNQAVSPLVWGTPVRYALLLKLSLLFDNDVLKKAWAARIELDSKEAEIQLIEICELIKNRVQLLPDERSRQLIGDALQWAIDSPSNIHYNVSSKADISQITPNLIGFQFVIFGIASRLRKHKRAASKIVVDQQLQFNKEQKALADFYVKLPNKSIQMGINLPEMNLRNVPTIPITFASSKESAGLEIVDLFLWVFMRMSEGKELPIEVQPIILSQIHRGRTDGVSLSGLSERWNKWLEEKRNLSEDELKVGKEIYDIQKELRLKSIKKF